MNTATHISINWETLPQRMRELPLDERGFPVPWFVAWIDGKTEFRAMDPRKWHQAVRKKLCWVCGQRIGAYLAFVIGPMCGVNRTTSEPPCHLDCARWSAQNCPFLSRPHMHRREAGMPEQVCPNDQGIPIARNPGVALVWVTKSYSIFRDEKNHPLIEIGEPEAVEFYAEGRVARRAEIEESVRTGLPILEEVARQQEGGMEALTQAAALFRQLIGSVALA
jgi:hypothetical protein